MWAYVIDLMYGNSDNAPGRWVMNAIYVAILLVSLPLSAFAQTDEVLKERLQVDDYKYLCLWMDTMIGPESKTPVTPESIQRRVEVRLRGAGIPPLNYVDNADKCRGNSLKQYVLKVKVTFAGELYSVDVEFVRQAAWWISDKEPDNIRSGAVGTWTDTRYGMHRGTSIPVMETLDDALDRFLAAYLKANQQSVPKSAK